MFILLLLFFTVNIFINYYILIRHDSFNRNDIRKNNKRFLLITHLVNKANFLCMFGFI